ncbi:Acyl-CoA dehydrogenase [Pseudomonas helmanticensis]|uniref:Acyl-CoA dehydrogenase n=1 Tax=Pseudomonas helmanticensis TaxID=1471381 RepID=A0ACD2UD97_9PSED|nr:acyl-CoA dehydrogenase family protein [Pseudomonas helmanticensis]SMQ30378.1 Acyl-CoA dehydrogenase [Pseudomonas helmanticensis]
MLDLAFSHWLDKHAQGLDSGSSDPQEVLAQLALANVLRVGISPFLGGNGKNLADAVETLAAVASHSMTAAFVLWGQRTFIEYVLQSSNFALRERLLPFLLDGKLAGATGLSNAIKFLSGIEALQVQGTPAEDGWALNGGLHWVTNLRRSGFVVAAAVEDTQGGTPFILAIPGSANGLHRSEDLQLMGLQSSNTAALDFDKAKVSRDWLLHEDAQAFLQSVRPAFLGLQCGMSIGLARRSLQEVEEHLQHDRSILLEALLNQRWQLEGMVSELKRGLLDGRFREQPAALFCLRISLAESAANAVQLELQASGGKAYLVEQGIGFARRWRESAFIPVVTPTLVQLRAQLQR